MKNFLIDTLAVLVSAAGAVGCAMVILIHGVSVLSATALCALLVCVFFGTIVGGDVYVAIRSFWMARSSR